MNDDSSNREQKRDVRDVIKNEHQQLRCGRSGCTHAGLNADRGGKSLSAQIGAPAPEDPQSHLNEGELVACSFISKRE